MGHVRLLSVGGAALVTLMLLGTGLGVRPSPARAELPAATATAPCGWATSAPPVPYDHVIVVIFENKSWKTVFKSGNAPYLTDLAAKCGRGDNMQALSNTSLANYVALTSGTTGSNGEITSNADPTVWPQSGASIFEHLGGGAVQLAESQPGPCAMKGSGDFIINHAPLQYYTRINSTWCPTQALALGNAPSLSARYTLVIPNRCHDMHKCSTEPTIADRVKAGDQWASTFVPTLIDSAEYQAGRTAIFITWDEGNLKSFQIPFIVISPFTPPGLTVTARYDHYSMLKAVQQMLGDPVLLGHAGDATTASLAHAYGLQ